MAYIGVTKNPKSRMNAHACSKTPTRSIIKNAMQKYGRDKFTLQVLAIGTQKYCYELEHKVIDSFNTLKPNGYNICTGGVGAIGIFGDKNGMYGKKHSPETIEKIRQTKIGRKATNETKEKMRVSHLGQKRSAESCKRMRQVALNRSPELLEKMQTSIRAAYARKRLNKD
jgi:group I intron endonuclease